MVKNADKTVVYENYGKSTGMVYGIENAEKAGRLVEFRKLRDNREEEQNELTRNHSDGGLWGIILDKQRQT